MSSNVGNDVFGRRSGLKDFADAEFLQFGNVLIRNDSSNDDENIVELFFFHQFHDPGNKRHMGAGKDRKTNDIDILLQRGIDNLFGCLSRPV